MQKNESNQAFSHTSSDFSRIFRGFLCGGRAQATCLTMEEHFMPAMGARDPSVRAASFVHSSSAEPNTPGV
jgi:hypothetical protein